MAFSLRFCHKFRIDFKESNDLIGLLPRLFQNISAYEIKEAAFAFDSYKISEMRNVPQEFKCYKIQGLLNLNETFLPEETHWIFYRTGMYEPLKIGDTIRFKVSQTEVRQFRDLPNARNIYPDTLDVI